MTEVINVKILHLVLKKKWYEMQERGEKTEEYREINKYWCRRLYTCYTNAPGHWGQCQSWPTLEFDCPCHNCDQSELKPYTHVCFHYGYTQRCFINRIDSITIGRGNPEWGAPTDRDVFIIKHHREPSPFIIGKEQAHTERTLFDL